MSQIALFAPVAAAPSDAALALLARLRTAVGGPALENFRWWAVHGNTEYSAAFIWHTLKCPTAEAEALVKALREVAV